MSATTQTQYNFAHTLTHSLEDAREIAQAEHTFQIACLDFTEPRLMRQTIISKIALLEHTLYQLDRLLDLNQ